MNFITTADKTKLYFKDWGPTSGTPVILMSGWPLSSDSWDDQAMALAEAGHRVISYDRRGFGRSSQPFSGYDYDTLADDLAAVIDQTGARDVSLVGFSMGGGEVARYMSRHDGRNVIKTALIASVVPYMLKTGDNEEGTEQSVFDGMAKGMLEDRSKFFAGFFRDFFGVSMLSHPVSQELMDWARSMAMQASLKATLECAKSFASTDFRPDLAAFVKPTLVIHGTDDLTVPIEASGRAAARAIKQSTLIEYAGAPHGLFATHKARLSSDLLPFLRT
jgi:non-heme chloroperoxidase